jgi:hypothetical protein
MTETDTTNKKLDKLTLEMTKECTICCKKIKGSLWDHINGSHNKINRTQSLTAQQTIQGKGLLYAERIMGLPRMMVYLFDEAALQLNRTIGFLERYKLLLFFRYRDIFTTMLWPRWQFTVLNPSSYLNIIKQSIMQNQNIILCMNQRIKNCYRPEYKFTFIASMTTNDKVKVDPEDTIPLKLREKDSVFCDIIAKDISYHDIINTNFQGADYAYQLYFIFQSLKKTMTAPFLNNIIPTQETNEILQYILFHDMLRPLEKKIDKMEKEFRDQEKELRDQLRDQEKELRDQKKIVGSIIAKLDLTHV